MQPCPSFEIKRIDRLEAAALANCVGGELVRADLIGRRVSFLFQLAPEHKAALAKFQTGHGPSVDAARFNQSLRWARDIVFSTRREGGAE